MAYRQVFMGVLVLLWTQVAVAASLSIQNIAALEDLVYDDPKQALTQIEQLQLGFQPSDYISRAQGYRLKAEAYSALGLSDEIMRAANEGVMLLQTQATKLNQSEALVLTLLSKLHTSRANAFYYMNDLVSSRKDAEQSLTLARASKNTTQIAYSLVSYAEILDISGEYQQALQMLDEALKVSAELEDDKLHGLLFSTLGGIHLSLENEAIAVEYFEKSLAAYQNKNQFVGNIIRYNIASALHSIGRHQEAITYLDQVIPASRKFNDQSTLAYAHFTSAKIHMAKQAPDQAKAQFEQAAAVAEAIADSNILFQIYLGLATLHVDANAVAEAKTYLNKSQQQMGEQPPAQHLIKWHYANAKLAELEGNYNSAYQHAMLYAEYDHRYFKDFSSEKVQQLKLNLDVQAMTLEKERLEKQNALTKLQLTHANAERDKLIYLSLLVVSALLFATLLLHRQRKSKVVFQQMAAKDTLTGLYNRRAANDFLANEFERYQRYREQFCVALIDLDHFKAFNDNYGHAVGDKILIACSRALELHLRRNDILSRWGGEEFLLLLPYTDLAEARLLGERLLDSVRNLSGDDIPTGIEITFSMGVAAINHDYQDVDALIHQADMALYEAKNNGRNRIEDSSPPSENMTEDCFA